MSTDKGKFRTEFGLQILVRLTPIDSNSVPVLNVPLCQIHTTGIVWGEAEGLICLELYNNQLWPPPAFSCLSLDLVNEAVVKLSFLGEEFDYVLCFIHATIS